MIDSKANKSNQKKMAKERVKFLKNITIMQLVSEIMSFLLFDIFQVKIHTSSSSNKDIKREKIEEQNPIIREEILEVSDSNDDEDETDDIKIVNEVRAAANDPKCEPLYKQESTARPKSVKDRLGPKPSAARATSKAKPIKQEQASEDEWAPTYVDELLTESEGDQEDRKKPKRRVMTYRDTIKDQDAYEQYEEGEYALDLYSLEVVGRGEKILTTDRHHDLLSYEEIQNLAYGLVGHPTRDHHLRTAKQLLQAARTLNRQNREQIGRWGKSLRKTHRMSALRKLSRGEKSQMEEKWLQHNEKELEMREAEKTQRHVVKSHFAQDKHKDKDGPMSPEIKNIMTNHGNDVCPMAKKILAGKFPTPGTGREPTQWQALDHLVHCHLSAMRTNDVSSTWMDEKNNRPLANYKPDAEINQPSRSDTIVQNSKILAGVEEDEGQKAEELKNSLSDLKLMIATGELDLPDVIDNIIPDTPPKRGTGMTAEIKNVATIIEREGARSITQARTEESCDKALEIYSQKYQKQLVAQYDGDKGGFGDAREYIIRSKEGIVKLYKSRMAAIKAKGEEDLACIVLNKKPTKKPSAKKTLTPKVVKKATKPIRGDTKLMIEEATILNNIGDLPRNTDLGRLKQTSSSTTSGSVTSPPKSQTSSGSSGQRKRKSSEPSRAEGARKKYKSARAKEDIKDALADAINELDNEPKTIKRSTRIKNAKRASLAENPDVTEEEEVLFNAGMECHGENCFGEVRWRSYINDEPKGYWCDNCKKSCKKFGGDNPNSTSTITTWQELDTSHHIVIHTEPSDELEVEEVQVNEEEDDADDEDVDEDDEAYEQFKEEYVSESASGKES